jgi:hypothetical protein
VREKDPVHAAVENGQSRLPLAGHELVERREHAVERLAERLAAEEARSFVADLKRPDEHLLELLPWHIVETTAAPLVEVGPLLRLSAGCDDARRLDRARQRARDDEVELHVRERTVRGRGLVEPALREAHDLGIALACVRDLCMPHQVEPPPHGT